MILGIVIVVVLLGLFLLGHFVPSYPASTKTPSVPSIDLRVSEFAPDLESALEDHPMLNPLKGYKKPQQPNHYVL